MLDACDAFSSHPLHVCVKSHVCQGSEEVSEGKGKNVRESKWRQGSRLGSAGGDVGGRRERGIRKKAEGG